MIYKNDILTYQADGDFTQNIRILWIDKDFGYCYAIKMNSNCLKDIFKISLEEIECKFSTGEISKQIENSLNIFNYNKDISPSMIKRRDKAYEIVMYVLNIVEEPYIYQNSSARKSAVEEASKIYGVSMVTVYDYLVKFLKGCKLKDALLPRYFLCGNRNKRIDFRVTPGRKSCNCTTIVLQKEDFDNFEDIVLSALQNPSKKMSISHAYEILISRHYTAIINGKLTALSRKPTYEQFRYYYKKKDKAVQLINKYGENEFNLKARALIGSTIDHVNGAGFRYEVDSTQLDVYVVNSLTLEYIGPVELYAAMCPFSKEVGGFAIEVEGESINGYKLLLYNCHRNKASFTKEYGIDIKKEQWPAEGLPHVLLSDKGKMAQPSIEDMFENLNLVVENTATGRGDFKPNIESFFHFINEELKDFLPGAKVNGRRRCQPDERKKAILTISDLTKVIIYMIMQYNSRYIEDYDVSKEMLADKIDITPNSIWNYSLETQSGALQKYPNNVLVEKLLKTTWKTISRRGIQFMGANYINNEMLVNHLPSKAALGDEIKVKIAYDSNDLSYIFVYDNIEKQYIRCNMVEKDVIRLGKHVTERDIIAMKNQLKQQKSQISSTPMLEKQKIIAEITERASKRNVPKQNFDDVEETRQDETRRLKKANALIQKIDIPNDESTAKADEAGDDSDIDFWNMAKKLY